MTEFVLWLPSSFWSRALSLVHTAGASNVCEWKENAWNSRPGERRGHVHYGASAAQAGL